MFNYRLAKILRCLIFIFVLLPLGSITLKAQRIGSAAQGGSVRPERVVTNENDASAPVTIASTSTEECNPDTVNGTCPGTFSFSYGFNANASPRSGGNSSFRAGFAFAVYVTKRVFLEVDNDNVISTKDPSSNRTTGLGDTTFYVGADILLGNKPKQPALTILYGIKAPTASVSRGLGSGEVDHTILGALSKVVGKSKTTYLEFDIGNTFAGRQNSRGFDSFPFAAGILRQKLDKNKKFTLHIEFGGNFKTGNYSGDAYNLDYLETQISPSVAVRVGGRFGITDNISRAGLYFGLKFNGNLKKIF